MIAAAVKIHQKQTYHGSRKNTPKAILAKRKTGYSILFYLSLRSVLFVLRTVVVLHHAYVGFPTKKNDYIMLFYLGLTHNTSIFTISLHINS